MKANALDNLRLRTYLNSRILCETETEERRVALTFDDGPSERNTPRLLDLLKQKAIHATFFVVGKRVHQFPDVFQRVITEGHEVGNHTFTHLPLTLLPSPLIRKELRETNEVIMEFTGTRPGFMRPPMGWFNDRVLAIARKMGMRPVIGSIYPRDSNCPGTSVIANRVMARVAPGGIIILHDGGWRKDSNRQQTIDAADRITDALLEMNYRVGTIGELVS